MVGPDGFTAGLAAYGAAPTTTDRHITYQVEVVEGRFAGQTIETAVAMMVTVVALVAIAGPAVLVPLPPVIAAVRQLLTVVASSDR
jgi:hypothetical protein